MKYFLYLTLAFALMACTFQSKSEKAEANSAPSAADIDAVGGGFGGDTQTVQDAAIRKVDFKNFTFQPFCAGPADQPADVTVKNGEFSEEKQVDEYTDRFFFGVEDPVYGDVNGDGKEDAVILTICNTGGTGNFSEGFIYEMKDGKPALLARIPGGDRAYGGLVEAKIENGTLIVESYDPGETGAACCPELILTTKYKVRGGKLEQTGAASKREIYPTKRIEFAKGTSKSTFTVTFTQDDDIKRFSFGARRGQTLNVTVIPSDKSKTVEAMLLKGEAETVEADNRLTARLKENGNYTLQLRAFTEKDLTVSVTIEIK